MADPFEVRMRFTSQLQHLNASTTSATKAANYALKYSEFSDDLHSCILEQLERNNMNNRANIMYFLPALADLAKAQSELAYVRMMERDILRIVDLVAPDDGSGAANVKVVRKVLQQLESRGFLQKQTVVELEEWIAGRDNVVATSPAKEGTAGASEGAGAQMTKSTPHSTTREPMYNPTIKLDKRQIEQRIEEDRERHKRARETIWAIPQNGVTNLAEDAELEKMWEGVSDVNEDDFMVAREEQEDRRKCLEYEETQTPTISEEADRLIYISNSDDLVEAQQQVKRKVSGPVVSGVLHEKIKQRINEVFDTGPAVKPALPRRVEDLPRDDGDQGKSTSQDQGSSSGASSQ